MKIKREMPHVQRFVRIGLSFCIIKLQISSGVRSVCFSINSEIDLFFLTFFICLF